MDRKGAVVIPPGEMRTVGPFSGGVARVSFYDETASGPARYGRVDEKGQFVEEFYGYINKSGRFIWRSK
jgi:hypothetical protein